MAVYTGVDLEHAIQRMATLQVQLNIVRKLLESRIELRPVLQTSHKRLKDMIFLDISLDSALGTTAEKGLKNVNFANPLEVLSLFSLMLENLCLSTVNNEDYTYCTKDSYRICVLYKSGNSQWALQTKAILDRLQLLLAERSQHYQNRIQPSAQYLGNLLGHPKWTIDIFTEELIRSGCSAIMKNGTNCFVMEAKNLTKDISRLLQICFATCFDQNIFRDLMLKEGKAIAIKLKSNNLVVRETNSSSLSHTSIVSFSIPRGVTFKKKTLCGKYAASVGEFTTEMA
ncbi:unnamed protein product [Sphenostylis stenocarpa]|uniref:Alpha-glucan water dikinase phosphohistidine-like domain-containing protein n=1 Tax=Sphenostylis stenocarpa TaxID=92480 RepID=A0AA86VTC6_9FABA|nr:unnamed protein product [Sphenostylis stenocarpa]